MNDNEKLHTLEDAVKTAETTHGSDSLELVDALENCARFLRELRMRTLDAANMEAHARVIRSKLQHPLKEPYSPPPSVRFCAKTLKSNILSRPRLIVIAVLLLLLGTICVIILVREFGTATSPNLFFKKGSISGGAFIRWDSGSSEILRGQRIFLCRSELLEALSQDRSFQHIVMWKKGDYEVDGYVGFDFKSMKSNIDQILTDATLSTTETDIDGKYKFVDVPAGKYVLFSQFIHRYQVVKPSFSYLKTLTDRGDWCFWIVPIELTGESKSIDLGNSNIAAAVPVYHPESD